MFAPKAPRRRRSSTRRATVAIRPKPPDSIFIMPRLTDLLPATKYHVEIESDGRRSPPMYFVTAPTEDVPISIVFGADSRSGLKERREINTMIAELVAKSWEPGKTPILAFAHAGDFVYSGHPARPMVAVDRAIMS